MGSKERLNPFFICIGENKNYLVITDFMVKDIIRGKPDVDYVIITTTKNIFRKVEQRVIECNGRN